MNSKLKFLLPLSLSVFVAPTIAFVSCSKPPLTSDQINEQTILINNAIDQQFCPKVNLSKATNVGDIDSTIINFNEITKQDKNLKYEITNFEIPVVGEKDANVNVKVSSKLDSKINGTYYFKISSAIENPDLILAMTMEKFNASIEKTYLENSNFNTTTQELASIKVQESNLDITEKQLVGDVLTPILDNEISKKEFINNVQFNVAQTIANSLTEKSYQSNLTINIINITQVPNFEGSGELQVNISLGGTSVYTPKPFVIQTFSTQYANLERDLKKFEASPIIPTLLIGEQTTVPAGQLYSSYLSLDIPDNLNSQDFVVGITSTMPPTSAESLVEIMVSSKTYLSMFYKYTIKINQIVGYEKIVFTIHLSKIQGEK